MSCARKSAAYSLAPVTLGQPSMRRAAVAAPRRQVEPDAASRVAKSAGCALHRKRPYDNGNSGDQPGRQECSAIDRTGQFDLISVRQFIRARTTTDRCLGGNELAQFWIKLHPIPTSQEQY